MIGYGEEDTHFVMELTYNYNVNSYELGNDFESITIHSKSAVSNAKKSSFKVEQKDKYTIIESPDGYKFHLVDEEAQNGNKPFWSWLTLVPKHYLITFLRP